MNTRVRLAEVIADTERRAAAKQGGGAHTRIQYAPPGVGWGEVTPRSQVVEHPANSRACALQRHPQAWYYVYVSGSGEQHMGSTLGHTRAGVILHLLRQRKAFP